MTIENTLKDRNSEHGDFASHSKTCRALYSIIMDGDTAYNLKPVHIEALHMICHKIARIVNGNVDHIDSWHDIAGYAILVETWIRKEPIEKRPVMPSFSNPDKVV